MGREGFWKQLIADVGRHTGMRCFSVGHLVIHASIEDCSGSMPRQRLCIGPICIYVKDAHACLCVSRRSCEYVCMYACMDGCMYACMYVCMHACMHACMHTCMYERTYVRKYVHMCMHERMQACMYVCMYVRTHAA